MKTSYLSVATFVLITAVSGSVFADGSRIKDSTIDNWSNNKKATTTASGGHSVARTGSITIEGSKVKNSDIYNSANNKKSTTTASGDYSEATTGSVDLR
jgi:hypothetical protein